MTRSHEPEAVGEPTGEMIECCRDPAEEVGTCVDERLSARTSFACPTVALGIYAGTKTNHISTCLSAGSAEFLTNCSKFLALLN